MQLLSFSDLRAKGITYSRSHLYKLVRDGCFPTPIQLHPGTKSFWDEREIDALFQERLDARKPVREIEDQAITAETIGGKAAGTTA